MSSDLHLDTGRRILRSISASPCEYIELAFEAEKHALQVSGADRTDLRAAVQTLDEAENWSDVQKKAFTAYVTYLDEHIEGR